MPRIDRIRIANFRGASTEFSLSFAPKKQITLILGENGTGKTTIVDALDAIGNESGGSLTTKSSTSLKSHLPTVGHKPADIALELTAGGQSWTAGLSSKGAIVTSPKPCPPIHVLRRINLQRFIDSRPADRYKELKNLIGVENVEKSEESLKSSVDNVKRLYEQAVRSRAEAEEQLENIWAAEGFPGASWQTWADDTASADIAQLIRRIERLRNTRAAISDALQGAQSWIAATDEVIERETAVAEVERESTLR